MLQQTQVSTVIPYFERFMARFPTLPDLAQAEQDEVLHLWTGLGYYARARNLHKAAVICLAEHGGQLPNSLEGLCDLPGIGRSTAGAIFSIAFKQHASILDGNVKRVLTRFMAWDETPNAKFTRQLWALSDTLTPVERNADYTQAIMDLGATLCRRGQPDCATCPFVDVCRAHQLGIEKHLPRSKKRKTQPVKNTTMLILQDTNGDVLLQQRPPTGLWGGLWCPPEVKNDAEITTTLERLGLTSQSQQVLPAFRHTFSHFHLDITPLIIKVRRGHHLADNNRKWVTPDNPGTLGLAAPVKKLLNKLKMPDEK